PHRASLGMTANWAFCKLRGLLIGDFVASKPQHGTARAEHDRRHDGGLGSSLWVEGGARGCPGYKPSSFRTWEGGESGPSNVSMMIMRPPQHGQGGGSWSEEVAPVLSLLACAVRGDGTLRARRQSSSLSARWPLANRP